MWFSVLMSLGCISGSNSVPQSGPQPGPEPGTQPGPMPEMPAVDPLSQHSNGMPPPPNQTPPPPNQATEPTSPPCANGALPRKATSALGERQIVLEHCTVDGSERLVSARLKDSNWVWSAPETETDHRFEWVGTDETGGGIMVLRFWECPMDGCERASFFRTDAEGFTQQMGHVTKAHWWAIGSDGQLQYRIKDGFQEGYSVASANQAYAWDGQQYAPQGDPTPATEITTWPCDDADVSIVDPTSGEPSGDAVRVVNGDAIEAIQIGTAFPLGTLFQYRVNDQEFWARDWQQQCAG